MSVAIPSIWCSDSHLVHMGQKCTTNGSHKTLISKAFYFRSSSYVAVNFVFLKPTNKAFTDVPEL